MKEQTLFSMKRSASAAVRKTFNELYEKIPLYINDAIDAVIFFFVDEDVNRSWMYFLNQKKQKNEICLTPEERNEFMMDLSAQAMKKFTFELDPASRLLMMGATNVADSINFHMKFPDALVSNFRLPGTYGCIEGNPRFGKTSLAVTLMPIINQRFGFDILTNIVIDDAPEYIVYVQKLSHLVTLMAKHKNWVCILDETATFAGKKRALSTANIDFENLARYVGKMGGRLIMITHSFEMDIPTILQEWTTERYRKIELDRAKVILSREGGFFKMNRIVTGIPDAELKFKSEDITSLHFDISIKKLLERIQDDVSIEDAIREQLNKVEEEKKPKKNTQQQVKAMIKDKIKQGMKIKEAVIEVSKETGVTYHTAYQYYYI
jgi:hypothetical protein